MSTTLTETEAAIPSSPSTVGVALGRFEARRSLRHPLTWLGVAGSGWMMWTLGADAAPILERDSVFLAGAMLPVAAATLVVANYATLRQERCPELLFSQPGGNDKPILGVQLGLAGPVLVAVALQAVGLVYLFMGGPIGSIDWWELAVGPLVVAVFGLGGVVLGRRLRHPIVAPVTLVAVGAVHLLGSPDAQIFRPQQGPNANFEWLVPWMMPSAFAPIEDLTTRPSELHVFYLVALIAVLGFLATPSRGYAVFGVGLAVILVGAVVVISFMLPTGPRSGIDWREAAALQTCATEDGVEYCAFGFYQAWIPLWSTTVASVNSILPVEVNTVIQRPPNIHFDEPGTLEAEGLIVVFTEWDRQGAIPRHGFELAVNAAHSAVGLPTTPRSRKRTEGEIESIVRANPDHPDDLRSQLENEDVPPRSCSAVGQARAVVAVWLAAAALDRGDEALQAALTNAPDSPIFRIAFDVSHQSATTIGREDARLAQQLLALPTDAVARELRLRWGQVVDPATRSGELGSWFGLQAPSAPDPELLIGPCA